MQKNHRVYWATFNALELKIDEEKPPPELPEDGSIFTAFTAYASSLHHRLQITQHDLLNTTFGYHTSDAGINRLLQLVLDIGRSQPL